MSYASLQDLIDHSTLNALLIVADDDNTGAPESALVAAAIKKADAKINLYVGTRYDLPLPMGIPERTTDLLKGYCCTLALHYLSRETVGDSEAKQKAHDDVLDELKLIAKGTVVLAIDTQDTDADGVADESGEVAEFTNASRLFTRDSMKGVL